MNWELNLLVMDYSLHTISSMPITVLPPTLSNNQGTASWNGPRVPNGAQLGFGVYIQAVEVPISSSQQPRTSNAVLLPVGAN